MPNPWFNRQSPLMYRARLLVRVLAFVPVMIAMNGASADERLSGLLEGALQRSLELKLEQSRIAARGADLDTARAALLPRLVVDGVAGFSSSGFHSRPGLGQASQSNNYAEIRLSMQHLLLDGGARQRRIDAEVSNEKAAHERYRFTKGEVLRETLTALVHYHHGERVMAHWQAALGFAREQLALEERRHHEGIATITELEQVRAHVHLVRTSLISAKGASRKARSRVGSAIGLPDLAARVPQTLEAATSLAVENHPLLAASGHQVGAAMSRVEQERAEMLPAVFLEGHVAKGTDPVTLATDSRAIGLRVSIPLIAPATARARLTRQHEAQVQVELERDTILRDIVSQVGELYDAMRLSRENLKAGEAAVGLMARVLAHAVEERDFDLRTTPELLHVHSRANDVALDHLHSRLALEMSQVEILAATGSLYKLTGKKDHPQKPQHVTVSSVIAKTDAWATLRVSSGPQTTRLRAKRFRRLDLPAYTHSR